MQRHRAGRTAVFLSLKKIDSKPDGVARTACVKPRAQLKENGRTPSTVGLIAPSASENSMEGSENEGLSQNLTVSGSGSQPRRAAATKIIQDEDSGLKMSIDITQAANVLHLEDISEECSSASDDSGIQMRETAALGSKSPNHDGGQCSEPPYGAEPNGATSCDQSCADVERRTPSAAQLLRHPLNASNDYLGKPSHPLLFLYVCKFVLFVV